MVCRGLWETGEFMRVDVPLLFWCLHKLLGNYTDLCHLNKWVFVFHICCLCHSIWGALVNFFV